MQNLDQININHYNTDANIMNQFHVLKNLINRRQFSLTDKQIKMIHLKFQNFSIHRKSIMHDNRKQNNEKRLMKETQPSFQPNVNKQKRMQKSATTTNRNEMLYNQGLQARERQNQQRYEAQKYHQTLD